MLRADAASIASHHQRKEASLWDVLCQWLSLREVDQVLSNERTSSDGVNSGFCGIWLIYITFHGNAVASCENVGMRSRLKEIVHSEESLQGVQITLSSHALGFSTSRPHCYIARYGISILKFDFCRSDLLNFGIWKETDVFLLENLHDLLSALIRHLVGRLLMRAYQSNLDFLPKVLGPPSLESEAQLGSCSSSTAHCDDWNDALVLELLLEFLDLRQQLIDGPSREAMLPDAFYIFRIFGLGAYVDGQDVVLQTLPVLEVDLIRLAFNLRDSLLNVLGSAPLSQRLEMDHDVGVLIEVRDRSRQHSRVVRDRSLVDQRQLNLRPFGLFYDQLLQQLQHLAVAVTSANADDSLCIFHLVFIFNCNILISSGYESLQNSNQDNKFG